MSSKVHIILSTCTFRSASVSLLIFLSLMFVQLRLRFQNCETLRNIFSFIWMHACCFCRSLNLYHEVNMFYYMIALHSHLRLSDINEVDDKRQYDVLSIVFHNFSHVQIIINCQRICCQREWFIETDSLDDVKNFKSHYRNIEMNFSVKLSLLYDELFTLIFWWDLEWSEVICIFSCVAQTLHEILMFTSLTFFYNLNSKDVVQYSLLCHICQCDMKVDCISDLNFFEVLDFIDNFLLFEVKHYLVNKLSLIVIKIDILQSEIALLFIRYKKLWMMNHLIIHCIVQSQDHAIKVNHHR